MNLLFVAAVSISSMCSTAGHSRDREFIALLKAFAEKHDRPGVVVKMPPVFWSQLKYPNANGHPIPEDIRRMDRGIERMVLNNIATCRRMIAVCKAFNLRPDLIPQFEATIAKSEATLATIRERRASQEKSQADRR